MRKKIGTYTSSPMINFWRYGSTYFGSTSTKNENMLFDKKGTFGP